MNKEEIYVKNGMKKKMCKVDIKKSKTGGRRGRGNFIKSDDSIC